MKFLWNSISHCWFIGHLVCWSVRPLVTLLNFLPKNFLNCINAPAHAYVTDAVMYTTLFLYLYTIFKSTEIIDKTFFLISNFSTLSIAPTASAQYDTALFVLVEPLLLLRWDFEGKQPGFLSQTWSRFDKASCYMCVPNEFAASTIMRCCCCCYYCCLRRWLRRSPTRWPRKRRKRSKLKRWETERIVCNTKVGARDCDIGRLTRTVEYMMVSSWELQCGKIGEFMVSILCLLRAGQLTEECAGWSSRRKLAKYCAKSNSKWSRTGSRVL